MAIGAVKEATPATPATDEFNIFYDLADKRLKYENENSLISLLQDIGLRSINHAMNGGFMIQQRIAVAVTNIAGISITTRAGVVADRWAVTSGNATTPRWAQIDTQNVPETNLNARYYGEVVSQTNACKHILSQFSLNKNMAHLRGRQVRLQCKIIQKVGSNQTYKIGLLILTNAGTVDAPPQFISAIGADTVDPTWGANLQLIVPDATPLPDGGSVSGNWIAMTSSTSWQRVSGTFTIPSNAKNIYIVIMKDAAGANTDNFGVSEVGLYLGQEIRDWVEEPFETQLLKCQAYYAKTFAYATVPVVGAGINTGEAKGVAGKAGAVANAGFIYWRFPYTMWRTPVTVTLFGPVTTTLVRDETATVDHSSSVTAGTTDSSTRVTSTGNASTAVGDEIGLHITADAEMVA